MLKKKLTSLVLALSMAIASTASFPANASGSFHYWGQVSNTDVFKDFIMLDENCRQAWMGSNAPEDNRVYAGYDERFGLFEVYEVERAMDYVYFELPANCDRNVIDNILDNISGNDSLDLEKRIYQNDKLYGGFYVRFCDENGNRIKTMDQETANEIYDLIGEYATEFRYNYGYYYYNKLYCRRSLYYSITYYNLEDSEKETKINDLISFIQELDLNAEIVISPDYKYDVDIVPNETLTVLEFVETVQKIYEKTGIIPDLLCLESPANSLEIGGTVDMKNAVKGDANDDSEISIADATAILQALGNPDKYALSAQGEYNADVDGKAGITPSDAIAIQQYDAKLVTELPVK